MSASHIPKDKQLQNKSTNYSPLLIVVAVSEEADLIIPRLKEVVPIGGRRAYSGAIGRLEVLLIISGMGVVNAASALTAALENNPRIKAVLNLGCAGAYAESGLQKGQAALADQAVHADSGVLTADRLFGLEKIGLPLVHEAGGDGLFNRLPVDRKFCASLAGANPGIKQGAFAAVNQVSGDASTAARVRERWGVIIEEMEGAALAQVALHYGVPFAAVRGVSNICGARDLDVKAGAQAAQRAFIRWGENL